MTKNNFQEAQKMLHRINSLAVYNKRQESIEQVMFYAKLLESLIEQAKGNVVPDEKTISETEKWLEMVRGIASKKRKKEEIDFFVQRINLLQWLVNSARKGGVLSAC